MLSSGTWSIRCSIQVQLMRIERLASSDRERPIVDHLHCGRPSCWARWRVAICDASTGLLKVLETKLLRCDVGALGWLLVLRRAIPAMNGVGKTVPFGVAQGSQVSESCARPGSQGIVAACPAHQRLDGRRGASLEPQLPALRPGLAGSRGRTRWLENAATAPSGNDERPIASRVRRLSFAGEA